MARNVTGTLLSRLGTGVLNGYLARTERERQEKALADEQSFALSRDQANRDFQTQRDTTQFGYDKQLQDERLAADAAKPRGGTPKTEDEIASMVESVFPGIAPEGITKILGAWDGVKPLYKVGLAVYPNTYPLKPKEYKPEALPDVPEPNKMTHTQRQDSKAQYVKGWQMYRQWQASPESKIPGAPIPPGAVEPGPWDQADDDEAGEYMTRGFTQDQAARFIEADILATNFADSVEVASRTDKVLNGPRFRQIAEQILGKKLVAVPESIHEAYLLGTQEGWSFDDVEKVLSTYFGRPNQFGDVLNAE